MSNDQQGPDPRTDPQPGYAQQPGYVPETGYAQEPGYVPETGYAQEPGYVAQTGYAQPPGYAPQPGYAQQPGAYRPPQPPTDGLSIAALVTGLLGFGFVPIVLGVLGLRRTRANGTAGRGLAIAGIVLGGLAVVAGFVLIAIMVIATISTARLGLGTSTSGDLSVSESAAPTADAGGADPAEDGSTPLLDVAPLEVAGFVADGFVPQDEVLAAGALESYAASYTDGTSVVDAVLTDWTTEAEAQAWAATQDAVFTPEQLIESGEAGDGVVYRIYEVGDVTTIVATNYTAALTLRGSNDAVVALYQAYPL